MNDPRIKKLLSQLVTRPESFNPEDMEEESIDADLAQKVQGPDEEYEVPAEIQGMANDLTTTNDKVMSGLPNKQYTPDAKIMELMKNLKNPSLQGQSVVPESEQETEETIEDPEAPEQVRRAAIQKVRQKYLGQ